MCVPGTFERVAANWSRRAFLEAGLAGLAGAATGCEVAAGVAPGGREPAAERPLFPAFRRVVDLTHTYSDRFPHFRGGPARVELERELAVEKDGWNMFSWHLDEHAGTHIDAPIHRAAGGLSVDRIPAEELVLPLAVVDLRERARRDPDARLTAGDLKAWETRHGPLPPRACVALLSGWDRHVDSDRFFGFDAAGVRHFPGFHLDAIEYFLEERDVRAIATDTASLDHGPTADFPVHTRWLGAGRWGLENAARLDELPPRGATICCGAPKVAGATGGPARVFALL